MSNEETKPNFLPVDALDRCPSCREWVFETSEIIIAYANCGKQELFHRDCFGDLAHMDDEDER